MPIHPSLSVCSKFSIRHPRTPSPSPPPPSLTFHALHGGGAVVTGRRSSSSRSGLVVPVKETVGGPLRRHCRGRVGTRQKHGIQGPGHDGGDAEGVSSWGQRVGQFHRVRGQALPLPIPLCYCETHPRYLLAALSTLPCLLHCPRYLCCCTVHATLLAVLSTLP